MTGRDRLRWVTQEIVVPVVILLLFLAAMAAGAWLAGPS